MDIHRNDEPCENVRDSRKILKPYRNIFSQPITVNRNNDRAREHTKTCQFFPPTQNLNTLPSYENSGTQTSKTIIELATIEKNCTRSYSPDSLCGSSPIKNYGLCDTIPEEDDAYYANFEESRVIELKKNKGRDNIRLGEPRDSDPEVSNFFDCQNFTPDGSLFNSEQREVPEPQKPRIIPQIPNLPPPPPSRSNNSLSFPNNSLVHTFLEKTKNRTNNLPTGIRNNQFKSHSYIEPSRNYPGAGENYQTNRFVVKSRSRQQRHSVYKQPVTANRNFRPQPGGGVEELQDDVHPFVFGPPKQSQSQDRSNVQYCQFKRSNSFMQPTIASERRSCSQQVETIKRLLSPPTRGRSPSPSNRVEMYRAEETIHSQQVPYIDVSNHELSPRDPVPPLPRRPVYKEKTRDYSPVHMGPVTPKIAFDDDLLKIDQLSIGLRCSLEDNSTARTCSMTSIDSTVANVLNKIRHEDWNVSLKALAEVTDLCRNMDAELMMPHMTTVNQKLLELLRSPRSHVCRTACQAAGHLFESMKDIRKPEFDDIVNSLLYKTADANKFIRQDANLSLDCMVTHISSFHAIKALCAKGPAHKNPLVRCATIRLIICAVVISGPDILLNPLNNEYTRRRVIVHLYKFLQDKNLETRKYAERLYKVLSREKNFEAYLKKYLEKQQLDNLKKSLKYIINCKK